MDDVERETDLETPEESGKITLDDAFQKALGEAKEVEATPTEAPISEETVGRGRNADGTFKKKEARLGDPNENRAPLDAPAPSDVQPDGSVIPAPRTWKADEREMWGQLPRTLQERLSAREEERNKIFQQRINDAQNYINRFGDIDSALSPISKEMDRVGATPGQVIRQLLAERDYIRQNPQEAIQSIAETYGIDLTGANLQAHRPDATTQALMQELKALREEVHGQRQHAQSQYFTNIEREIDAFANETDDKGQPLRPYFSDVQEYMTSIVTRLKAQHPGASSREVLEKAYDEAVYANPMTRKLLLEAETRAREAKRIEEDRKAAKDARLASSSVRGAPLPNTTRAVNRKNLDEIMRAAAAGDL